MEVPLCPLSHIKIQHSNWELGDLLEMEHHIATETNCQHPQLNTWVLSETLEGSTPLLMACDKGNLASVKKILETWEGVDVNTTAVYYYKYTKKSSKIRKQAGASPLFVAAYAGHKSVVRYLMEKGARIDITTSETTSYDAHEVLDGLDGSLAGLNPLHGALSSLEYNERLDIIRLLLEAGADPSALTSSGSPIWTARKCFSDEVTLLIEHGMSLTQRCNRKNRTVLHHWASEDPNSNSSARVFQLLLKKGADLQARDAQNLTPVLAAAQCSRRFYFKPKFPVLNFLSKSEDIDRMEKIDVLELAGAVIISNKRDDNRYTPLAFDYWRQALHLYGSCRKTPLVLETVSYNEWSTVADLEEIENHPIQQKIHSLLVQLRIYSNISWEAFYEFIGKCLGFPDFDDAERFRYDSLAILLYLERNTIELEFVNGALDFWWILLEVVHQRFDIRQEKVWLFTIKLIRRLVDHHLRHLERPHLGQLHLNSLESLKKSLTLIAKKNLINLPTDTVHRAVDVQFHLKTLCKLFSILVRLPAEILDEEVMSLLKKLVNQNYCSHHGYHLLNLSLKKYYRGWYAYTTVLAITDLLLKSGANPNSIDSNRRSPLHLLLLSTKRPYDYTSYANITLAMVDLLLKAGADPNSIDNERNCPLHLLALLQNKTLNPVGHLLRDAGTHLDRANRDGRTVAELWFIARDEKSRDGKRAWKWSDLPYWCRKDDFPNLSCLCARIVRRFKVPYKDKVPTSICTFVDIH